MIFILVPPVFTSGELSIRELSYAHAQQKMTTPSRTDGQAMASDFDFRGGKSRIVTILIYVKSTKALLVKMHIACPNRTDLCENYGL